jgi:hypothetical protein
MFFPFKNTMVIQILAQNFENAYQGYQYSQCYKNYVQWYEYQSIKKLIP